MDYQYHQTDFVWNTDRQRWETIRCNKCMFYSLKLVTWHLCTQQRNMQGTHLRLVLGSLNRQSAVGCICVCRPIPHWEALLQALAGTTGVKAGSSYSHWSADYKLWYYFSSHFIFKIANFWRSAAKIKIKQHFIFIAIFGHQVAAGCEN